MNEKNNSEFDTPETNISSVQYHFLEKAPSETNNEENPVMLRRKIKNGYSWASSVILWQQLFAAIFILIFSSIFSAVMTPRIMAENPDFTIMQVISAVQQLASEGMFVIISNAGSMILANILAIIIVYFSTKRFKFSGLFAKPEFPVSGIILAALGILGLQGFSIFFQNIITALTGLTGMNEQAASALSFTGNSAANAILILYAVILAPVLEEIMFRGLALNCLAPVNRTFALVASSLLFGLMHCNFNQIFNGFLLGLLLGYIALKCGSIVPSIICHIAANANAMAMSYIFEYKLVETLGDTAYTYEMIVFAAELVIGGAAAVILLKKYGRIKPTDIIISSYTYEFEEAEEKKLTWKLLLKSPAFWVAAAYCILSACMMVTSVV